MRTVKLAKKFKHEYDLMQKRGKDIGKLDIVIFSLAMEGCLPPGLKDHPLRGRFIGFRSCHIETDWILIYAIDDESVYLSRTGSHADIYSL
ncbi:MAG: type II toxin-antitoxin system YafQ family toxin [Synergistaceae bacterium]|jgi:mRNA interferase YafQ|nr:type II toxin-antitoxin system YafQ family toxin [Synergistaceae bacterium]